MLRFNIFIVSVCVYILIYFKLINRERPSLSAYQCSLYSHICTITCRWFGVSAQGLLRTWNLKLGRKLGLELFDTRGEPN